MHLRKKSERKKKLEQYYFCQSDAKNLPGVKS